MRGLPILVITLAIAAFQRDNTLRVVLYQAEQAEKENKTLQGNKRGINWDMFYVSLQEQRTCPLFSTGVISLPTFLWNR
jgi:hypothetical protein